MQSKGPSKGLDPNSIPWTNVQDIVRQDKKGERTVNSQDIEGRLEQL